MSILVRVILLTIFLSSCGLPFGKDFKKAKHKSRRQFSTTNPKFNSIIKEFEQDAKEYKNNSAYNIGDIPINFGDTEDPQFDGVCIMYSNGQKEIIIKESWWNTADITQRRLMIYHELGHCALNRDHNDSIVIINKQNYKLSIMNSYLPSSDSFEDQDRQTGYLEELFNRTTTKIMSSLNSLKK